MNPLCCKALYTYFLVQEPLKKASVSLILSWVEQPCLGTRSNYQFNAELSIIYAQKGLLSRLFKKLGFSFQKNK